MSNLNRRDFLKVLGVTSTSTVVACDPPASPVTRTLTPIENVLPYVVQPEQIVPGLPTWFATQCNECDKACGVLARNREGRVVKLEGNPDHPVNAGSLCAQGLAGIQATYSPDRFAAPQGAASWEEAIAKVAGAVKGKKVAWLGKHRTGSLAALVGQLMDATGGTAVMWEPLGEHALQAATEAVFGIAGVPRFDLAGSHTILSFGYEILGSQGTPAQYKAWADTRDPKQGGYVSRTVSVGARVGSTAALADAHLAAAPGSEVGVAMALARLVADKKGYSGPAAALLSGVDVAGAAQAAGLTAARLEEVAGWLAAHPSTIVPGGPATSASATALATAVLVLNEVAGNVGKSLTFASAPNTGSFGSWADAKALLDDCAAGKVDVLFVDGLDPVFTMPAEAGVADALSKVGLVVHFADEPNDSITSEALVLPPGSTLESWGDAEAHAGVHTLQQAAMNPLHSTRPVGDVLLAVAKAAGLVTATEAAEEVEQVVAAAGEEAAPAPLDMPGLDAPHYLAYLKGYWQAVVWDKAGRPGEFETFWTDSLQRGGYWTEAPGPEASFQLASAPAAAAEVGGSGDKTLLVWPHPYLGDGRHANKPWAQEVPEPLSSNTWGTWVEINSKTAEAMGVRRDDTVKLTTASGSLECGVFINPSIREDAVALVLGNGKQSGGRYASYGANAMSVLGLSVDEGGAFRFVSTKASLSKVEGASPKKESIRYLGSLTNEDRGVNYVVSIEDYNDPDAAHGAHGIIAMHHPPVDDRLIERGLHDMYPEPNHPTYRFAMAVDLNRCTGCGACSTACYSENNIPVVGPDEVRKSRHMGWLRLGRYWQGDAEFPDVRFQPNMCQQCSHAPCEGVCPVLATYHNLDGLNAMIYNRCVGTRYCANNCPYSSRRFNYHSYKWPESFNLMLNPEVVTREMGVMEKCTFCVQRLREVKDVYRDNRFNGSNGPTVAPDSALKKLTACASACPADAITFGNANDPEAEVSQLFEDKRAYKMLGELNTKPGVRYLARVNHVPSMLHHGGGHGGGGDHGEGDHGDAGHGDASHDSKDASGHDGGATHDGDAAH